ncbi:MAG: dockerin type I repeat-containing protein [Oscillospiraceae bacterium]|nr:dockerin type I repeat-containing protein [Oscillospiraceae bacterium]
MKKTIKFISILSAMSMLLSAAPSVSAMTVDDKFEYECSVLTTESRENVIYIDSDKLKDGDYTFNAAIYINSEDEIPERLSGVTANWEGYSEDGEKTRFVHFSNMSAYNPQNAPLDEVVPDLNPDGSVTGTTSYVKYVPTCFSKVLTLGENEIIKNCLISISSKYMTSPEFTPLYSAGPFKIKYQGRDSKWYTYDLTWDEKTGDAVTTEPARGNTSYGDEVPLKIRDYDPEIPEGEMLPDYCRHFNASNPYGYDVNWYGGKSNAYPLVTFDVSIDKDTKDGVYYVGFTNYRSNDISFYLEKIIPQTGEMGVYAHNIYPNNVSYINPPYNTEIINDRENWLKIVVGNPEEAQAETECDVNNDGTVDVTDAAEVLRIYAESASSDEANALILKESAVNADVNGDGTVDVADAALVLETYSKSAASVN